MQTRKHSVIESLVSTGLGYIIAVIATQMILPMFGLPVRLDQNLAISGLFTVISVVRGYCIRRLFNWWGTR